MFYDIALWSVSLLYTVKNYPLDTGYCSLWDIIKLKIRYMLYPLTCWTNQITLYNFTEQSHCFIDKGVLDCKYCYQPDLPFWPLFNSICLLFFILTNVLAHFVNIFWLISASVPTYSYLAYQMHPTSTNLFFMH